MQCMISGCTEEFIDTASGLAEMTFHVIIHHDSVHINGKKNEAETRSRNGEEEVV